jgi:UDP-glucose 4-epimerase
MRVLVTGGAGFIGSHTVSELRARGDEVVVLDSLEYGHRQAVGDTPLYVGRTHDIDLVRGLLRDHKLEAVIHFAAYKAVGESVSNPGKYFDNNVIGSLRLIEAMRAEGVGILVFSSTAAVYGNPSVLPVVEQAELRPENPYGESKLAVERVLPWYDRAHGLRSICLRYFNAAGAALDGSNGEDPRVAQNLIPLVMKAATGRAAAIQVFGTDYPTPDGTCIRDYIHVLDLADAHLRALDHLVDGGSSDILNLGTGQGASVLEVLGAARRAAGRDIPTKNVARRPGDPVSVWADNRKARERLGWNPRYGLEEIVASAWKWQSGHPDGFLSGPSQPASPGNRASESG